MSLIYQIFYGVLIFGAIAIRIGLPILAFIALILLIKRLAKKD